MPPLKQIGKSSDLLKGIFYVKREKETTPLLSLLTKNCGDLYTEHKYFGDHEEE